MNIALIEDILKLVPLEEVAEGIFSCLSKADRYSSYDKKVNVYDRVVGNRFYNKLVWGNWPVAYLDFCKQALTSAPDGIFLDAGCGSLVFTARAYSEAGAQLIILLDRSIGMLVKGRDRIKKLRGTVPDNIIFIQGDIFNLPFQDRLFDTVASFGVLHIFDNKLSLLSELERVKRNDGTLFFSSLVGNNTIGRRYLDVLKRAGEVATCYSTESLSNTLSAMPFKYRISSIGNVAYARSA